MKILALAMLAAASVYGQQWVAGYHLGNNGVQSVQNIPWSKYTHIIHFAANPGANGTLVDGSLSPSENSALVAAGHAAGVKVLFSITSDTSYFPADTSSGTIDTFVSNIVGYMNTYGYDGVDLDWEASIDVNQYANLITKLRAAVGNSKLITVAGYPGGGSPMQAVVQAGPDLLDQVNMMTYDEDMYVPYTWFVTSLLAGPDSQPSIQSEFQEFVSSGIPARKLGIGIGMYARHYSGAYLPNQSGASRVGAWTNYRDLVSGGLLSSANQKYDSTHGGSYLSLPNSNEFYPYTSPQMIQDIVAWGKAQGIGGFMTFDLDEEYVPNQTGDARFPLSAALHSSVFGSGVNNTPPPPPPTDPGPVLSAGLPSGALTSTTTSTTLSLATNVNATCSYSTTAGTQYSAMQNIFAVTGGTTHSTTVSNLQPGTKYTYYVKCADVEGVANSADYVISFSVSATTTTPAAPTATLTPATGSGLAPIFVLRLKDSKGYSAIQQVDLFIGNFDGTPACYIDYWAPTKTLSLWDDSGSNVSQATLGTSTVLKNSQCSINAHAATVSGSGTTLTLHLPVVFSSRYAGTKPVFTFVADSTLWSGWKQSGTWTVK